MLRRLRRQLRSVINAAVEPALAKNDHDSPLMKVMQRQLYNFYQSEVRCGRFLNLSDTGFRNFSQFDEDGILLYMFAALGVTNKLFVDIGAGNGINGNCANLAINFGWNGLFIDGNTGSVDSGKAFYEKHPDTWVFPPKFVCAMVQRENINQIIEEQGFTGEVDLVSIDIDGNDYWVWDALSVIEPRVVIIETRIEFGLKNLVVPYDKDFYYQGEGDYYGASLPAMIKLADKKGYRLVGANLFSLGFNTIYVKRGVGEDILPEQTAEAILSHPHIEDRFKLFEPIKNREFVNA